MELARTFFNVAREVVLTWFCFFEGGNSQSHDPTLGKAYTITASVSRNWWDGVT